MALDHVETFETHGQVLLDIKEAIVMYYLERKNRHAQTEKTKRHNKYTEDKKNKLKSLQLHLKRSISISKELRFPSRHAFKHTDSSDLSFTAKLKELDNFISQMRGLPSGKKTGRPFMNISLSNLVITLGDIYYLHAESKWDYKNSQNRNISRINPKTKHKMSSLDDFVSRLYGIEILKEDLENLDEILQSTKKMVIKKTQNK